MKYDEMMKRFKDVLPESYAGKESSAGSGLIKAAGLAAMGIAAVGILLKRKNKNANEKAQPASDVVIHVTRHSVCMGDDVMAPHADAFRLERDARVSELMRHIAGYVPAMRNYEWDILCNAEMIGKLISGEDCKYKTELLINDIAVSKLPKNEIFCRVKI